MFSESLALRERLGDELATLVLLAHLLHLLFQAALLGLLLLDELAAGVHARASVFGLALRVVGQFPVVGHLVQNAAAFVWDAAGELEAPFVVFHFIKKVGGHVEGNELKGRFGVRLDFLKAFKELRGDNMGLDFWLVFRLLLLDLGLAA